MSHTLAPGSNPLLSTATGVGTWPLEIPEAPPSRTRYRNRILCCGNTNTITHYKLNVDIIYKSKMSRGLTVRPVLENTGTSGATGPSGTLRLELQPGFRL